MHNPKIIALYLPQYHQIPENDEFWGKGFTDWVTVKKAKPLYKGHLQPRVPLNNNYYDLSLKENVAWQAKLAKKHGVYGFGVYHYWFNNEKNILTKPAEIIRDNDDIDINYFFIWDNANWKRSWSNVVGNDWAPLAERPDAEHKGPQILIPYILGREPDWENHYREVLSHFKKEKYIKRGNKPLFGIISLSKEILEMCAYWNQLAKADGFDGIEFVFSGNPEGLPEGMMHYSYEPHYSAWIYPSFCEKIYNRMRSVMHLPQGCRMYNYDIVWRRLLKRMAAHPEPEFVPGAFVGYDDSPRRGGKNSKIVTGASPEKFKKYMAQLLALVHQQQKDFVFLTAWNEWGEGAFIEPDSIYGEAYLTALSDAVDILNENE